MWGQWQWLAWEWGGGGEQLAPGGEEDRVVRERSPCIPFYTFWYLNHINIFLTQKLKRKHGNGTREILN